MNSAPTWTWAVPLIASIIALIGVSITIIVQWRNFNLQLKSAHTLKISEMRQAWINSLREAMASFQSHGVTPSLNHREQKEWYEAGTKIELLMNPSDPDYKELQDCMYAFFNAESVDDKFSANPKFVDVCQRILKREWEVLKSEVQGAGKSQ